MTKKKPPEEHGNQSESKDVSTTKLPAELLAKARFVASFLTRKRRKKVHLYDYLVEILTPIVDRDYEQANL